MRYTLDGKRVTKETMYVSLFVRALIALLGVTLIAAGTTFTFAQVFLVFTGAALVYGARTVTLTITE